MPLPIRALSSAAQIARIILSAVLILLILFLFCSSEGRAGTVLEIRRDYVLFNTKPPPRANDQFVSLDQYGQISAVFLVVRNVSGNRTVAKIKYGHPRVGEKTTYQQFLPKKENLLAPWRSPAWALGASVDRLDAKFSVPNVLGTGLTELALTGVSTGVSGGISIPLSTNLALNTNLGFLYLTGRGNSTGVSCNGSFDCFLTIDFATWQAGFKFFPITKQKVRYFVGAGLEVAFPLFSKSNTVNTSNIKTSALWQLDTGVEFRLSNRRYLQIEGDFTSMAGTSASTRIYLYGIHLSHQWIW
jgi:hypothetical protein